MHFAELLAELLMLFDDLKFWKNKKTRRKFEKENGLPKQEMVNPSNKRYVILILLIIPLFILFNYLFFPNRAQKETVNKISKIESLLEDEKKAFNRYPDSLSDIIRNNPTLKNITVDYWKNNFLYKTFNKGLSYSLISKGIDGILNTEDDIKITNK